VINTTSLWLTMMGKGAITTKVQVSIFGLFTYWSWKSGTRFESIERTYTKEKYMHHFF
jgi:hypothetical protein